MIKVKKRGGSRPGAGRPKNCVATQRLTVPDPLVPMVNGMIARFRAKKKPGVNRAKK